MCASVCVCVWVCELFRSDISPFWQEVNFLFAVCSGSDWSSLSWFVFIRTNQISAVNNWLIMWPRVCIVSQTGAALFSTCTFASAFRMTLMMCVRACVRLLVPSCSENLSREERKELVCGNCNLCYSSLSLEHLKPPYYSVFCFSHCVYLCVWMKWFNCLAFSSDTAAIFSSVPDLIVGSFDQLLSLFGRFFCAQSPYLMSMQSSLKHRKNLP